LFDIQIYALITKNTPIAKQVHSIGEYATLAPGFNFKNIYYNVGVALRKITPISSANPCIGRPSIMSSAITVILPTSSGE